jgi:four helix bundle protein
VRVVRLCDRISKRSLATRHVCQQLLKARTSIGSNAEEGQEAQTKADYLAKMAIARKEARETCYWLRLGVEGGQLREQEVEWERNEAAQLLKMVRAAIRTAKQSDHRGDGC